MYVSSLFLQGFRSHVESDFEFSDGVNIVVGPNASGKTNLLEALLVLGRGMSYRAELKDLTTRGTNLSKISAVVDDRDREVFITQNENERTIRHLRIEGVDKKQWRHDNNLPIVLFEPSHLDLVTGSPGLRRAFVDDLIEQMNPGYKTTRQKYQRALTQRNRLLKRTHTNDEIFVWDLKLCEYAEVVFTQRTKLTEQLNESTPLLYQKIAGDDKKTAIRYKTEVDHENYLSDLLKRLHKNYELDKLRGYTGSGPHRDDIELIIDGQPASTNASRGESRSIVLSLKLAENNLMKEVYATPPLFLLDDVFSELDTKRQQALSSALQDTQTLLTTTNADTWIQFKKTHFEVIRLG